MLNWGVMGAGGIAYVFCNGMRFYGLRADPCRCESHAIQDRQTYERLQHSSPI